MEQVIAEPMRTFKKYGKQSFATAIILIILLLGYQKLKTVNVATTGYVQPKARTYFVWPKYINNVPAKFNWFKEKCFSNKIQLKIHSIQNNIKLAEASDYFHCKKFVEDFNDIYTLSVRVGHLKMPKQFKSKVFTWLGEKEDLMKEVKHQEILHIKNKYTFEYTAYNPLRSKRPYIKPKVEPISYVLKLVKETKDSCDFCRFKKFTAEDDLGRLVTNLTATASNTFKYDAYHQLIFPRHCHNPLELTKDQVVDIFMTANMWFQKVHKSDKNFKYPMIMWDTFPHGGASQVHPHIQVSIDSYGYYGTIEGLRRAANQYSASHNGLSNYFTDLKNIHAALGLSFKYGSATAFAHLNSHKDYEVILMSERVNKDIFELLYFVIKAFNEDLGQLCFSFAAAFPVMGDEEVPADMPVILRILSRSIVSSMNADISSLELFLLYNVNVDPYLVIDAIRKSVEKRS